jgi:hypothetical protein
LYSLRFDMRGPSLGAATTDLAGEMLNLSPLCGGVGDVVLPEAVCA